MSEEITMYQALYRKWRPLTFDEVIGQEHVSKILRNQIANEKLSHATAEKKSKELQLFCDKLAALIY